MTTLKAFRLCLISSLLFMGLSASAQFRFFSSNKIIRAHLVPTTRVIEMPDGFAKHHLTDYADQVCWIKNPANGLWGLLDTAGNMLIEPTYTFQLVPKFSQGVCFLPYSADTAGLKKFLSNRKSSSKSQPIALKGSFSIDKTGKILGYFPQYEDVSAFADGLATVLLSGTVKKGKTNSGELWSAYINTRGEIQYPNLKQSLGTGVPQPPRCIKNGLRAHYDSKKQKWGYINQKGAWVISAQFEEVKDFSERRAAVRQDERWGFINPKGKMVIQPAYDDEPYDFSEAHAVVFKAGVPFEERAALIDTLGNIVLDRLQDALPFYHGVCFANGKLGKYADEKTFILDKQLRVIKAIKHIVWGHGNNSEYYPYFSMQNNVIRFEQEALSPTGETIYESTEKLRPFYNNRSKVCSAYKGDPEVGYWGFMNLSGEIVYLVLSKPATKENL